MEQNNKPTNLVIESFQLQGARQMLLRLLDVYRISPKEKQAKLQAQCGAMSAYVEILGQRIDEAKMEQKQQEAAGAVAAAAQKMRDSLVGRTIVEAGKCDTCPEEGSGCKKLILAGGMHICVK